jgi:CelD/BcsL family acetyltransferase involved in cellulose biosynthesis
MDATVLSDRAEIRKFMPEWIDLYSRAGNNLFQNPQWHRIWWDTIGQGEGWRPHVVAGHVGGRLQAVAPLAVRRARGLRRLEWAGFLAFDYPDLLSADGVNSALFWKLVRDSGGYDVAHIRQVRHDGGSCAALRSLARRRSDGAPVFEIELAHPSSDHWFKAQSKRTRANHLASIRQIEKIGPLGLNIVRDVAEVPKLVALLVDLKNAWAATRGVDSDLSRPGTPEFLEQVALQALAEGDLHLSVLTCGERIISIHLGFVSQDGFYYYQPSYDATFAKMSPGRLHLSKLIMWAIDNGYHRFDLLRGDDPYKVAIGKPARVLHDYMFTRGPVGAVAAHLHAARERITQYRQGARAARQTYNEANART